MVLAAVARPRVQVDGNDRNAVHERLRDIMRRHGLARRQPVSAPQHDALDALCAGINAKRVHFYFDADVRSFFHEADKSCLVMYAKLSQALSRISVAKASSLNESGTSRLPWFRLAAIERVWLPQHG
jgi:hypothetical protein